MKGKIHFLGTNFGGGGGSYNFGLSESLDCQNYRIPEILGLCGVKIFQIRAFRK